MAGSPGQCGTVISIGQGMEVQFPVKSMYPGPSWSAFRKQPIDVSISFSPLSLPSTLSKNHWNNILG